MPSKKNRLSMIAVSSALILAASSAAWAQSAAESYCRATISKNLRQFISVAIREVSSCYTKRAAGHLPADTECNAPLLIATGRSSAAYDKAAAAMRAACPSNLVGVLGQYARCPTPHSTLDDDGPTTGIDDFKELSDCLLNVSNTMIEGAGRRILGSTGGVVLSPAARKCQTSIGKAFEKRVRTIGQVRAKCQAAADEAGDGLSYSCAHYDDGKIAANLMKLEDAIDASCALSQDELVTIGSCGQSAEQLKQCVGDMVATPLGGGLVAAAYELPDTCKLGHVGLVLNAANGAKLTATHFDIGYNGRGHDVDLVDDFEGEVNLSCGPDCTECSITLAPVKELPKSYCRCDSDPTIHCDTISGPDLDDCGGGQCTCTFGPPLPLSASGVPACVVNELATELDGVADAGTGVSTTAITNRARIHLGESQTRPCPVCLGDPTPNDGLREGLCTGGSRNGLACDRNATSPDFGPVSYECPPNPGTNISGIGLRVPFSLTSIAAPTISTDLVDGAQPVFCLQCSGDTSVGCSSDADCAALGVGTCTVNTGPPAHANSCTDGVCTDVPGTDHGECQANAFDKYCDGVIRKSGFGLIPCGTQGDCNAYSSLCVNGDCGACALYEPRRCVSSPFGAVGTHGVLGTSEASGVYGTELVSTFCVAATPNVSINTSVGLPGPGRIHLDFDFDRRCESDRGVRFEPPGGSNCP